MQRQDVPEALEQQFVNASLASLGLPAFTSQNWRNLFDRVSAFRIGNVNKQNFVCARIRIFTNVTCDDRLYWEEATLRRKLRIKRLDPVWSSENRGALSDTEPRQPPQASNADKSYLYINIQQK